MTKWMSPGRPRVMYPLGTDPGAGQSTGPPTYPYSPLATPTQIADRLQSCSGAATSVKLYERSRGTVREIAISEDKVLW